MKKIKVIVVVVLFFIVVPKAVSQQIAQYSQYLFNPIYINPAYTGYKNDLFIQSFYRKQWVGLEGSPESFGVAADAMLNSQSVGIGMVAMADNLGLQSTQSLYANLAYHLQVGYDSYLSFGTGVGFVNYRMKSELYDPTILDDPTLNLGLGNIIYPDLRVGLLFYSEYLFAGVSVDQALENILNIDNVDLVVAPKRSLSFSLGGIIDVTDRLLIKPSFFSMFDFKANRRLDFNLFFMYDESIGLGLGHRRSIKFFQKDLAGDKSIAFILNTEIRLGEHLRLGYSYDYPMSGFWNYESHEISLGFLLISPQSRLRSPRYF
jgi:type IX secretion system PorP/SprF family membrane protein